MLRLNKILIPSLAAWLILFLPLAAAHHHEYPDNTPGLYPSHEDCPVCNFTYAGSDDSHTILTVDELYFNEFCYIPEQIDCYPVLDHYAFFLRSPPQF